MTTFTRCGLGLLLGMSLSLTVIGAAGAQELPTGAARIVEKVQTRIFISQANLTFHVADILENLPAASGK